MLGRKVRLTLIAIGLVGATLVVPVGRAEAAPAGASISSRQVQKRTASIKLSQESLTTLEQLRMINVNTGEQVRPLADPPGGGCGIFPSGEGQWWYENGVLILLEWTYRAEVECITTGPNQNMAGLTVQAFLWKDGHVADQALLQPCMNCLVVEPPSEALWPCAGVQCAGSYWVGGVAAMQLPAGWVWAEVPPNCILLGLDPFESDLMECSLVTDIATVSPTP